MMLVMSTPALFDTFKVLGIQKQATVLKLHSHGSIKPYKITKEGWCRPGARAIYSALTHNINYPYTCTLYMVEDDAGLLLKLSGAVPTETKVWMAEVKNVTDFMTLCLLFECDGQINDNMKMHVCNNNASTYESVVAMGELAYKKFGALFEKIDDRFLTDSKMRCCAQMLLEEFLGTVYKINVKD